ncbi:MAG: nucleoside-diphosphate kinase [Candidatus Altarchaeaceae archaeon]
MFKMREFIILKPDAVRNRLIGEIISRFEKRGIKIIGMKMMKISREKAEKLYEIHKGKKFYESLINYITSGKVVVCVLEADCENLIEIVRKMIGATDPSEALPGTIRGDFGLKIDENVIHASDSVESYNREVSIFFTEEELKE